MNGNFGEVNRLHTVKTSVSVRIDDKSGVTLVTDQVKSILQDMTGCACARQEVGSFKSLTLGFGDIDSALPQPTLRDYRKWEIGTYCCAWRISDAGSKILCGSQDPKSIGELDETVGNINFGRFARISQDNGLDILVELDDGIKIDFFMTVSLDYECFHIFCPDNVHIGYSVTKSWQVGLSNSTLT